MEPDGSTLPDQAEPVAGAEDTQQVEGAQGAPEQGSPEAETPFSMADALAAVKAAAGESPAGEAAPDEGSGASGEKASEAAPDAQKKGSGKLYDERGALQRILQLRREGKVGELPPEAQGLLRTLESELRRTAVTEHQARQQEEAEFKDLYLSNLALREQDPAAYAKVVSERPELAIFMKAYADEHPEVTLDDPDARPRKTEGQMVKEIAQQYGTGFEAMIDAIAADGGLDSEAIGKLKAEFRFGEHPDSMQLGTFGAKVITAVANVMAKSLAEKEIERVKVEERKAYDLQLQRVRGMGAQPPRQLPGGVSNPKSNEAKAGPVSMREAFEEGKLIVASR